MRDVPVPIPEGHINVWHRPSSEDAGTAVLVHGLSGNSRWWGAVIEHLPPRLGVIALDVRGRAGSADAPPPYDLTTVADDIARALDHLGTDRGIIAGYSMGGWVAALFGTNHPDRVERVILVDGGVPIPRDPDADPLEIIGSIVGPSLRRLEMHFDSEEAFFDHWKSQPAFDRYWADSMREALGHELVPAGDGFEVIANATAIEVGAREITVGTEANQAAAALEVPTHVLVVERGTLDQPGGMIPRDAAVDLVASNPNLTMEYLPGVNHYTLVLGTGAAAVATAIASTG